MTQVIQWSIWSIAFVRKTFRAQRCFNPLTSMIWGTFCHFNIHSAMVIVLFSVNLHDIKVQVYYNVSIHISGKISSHKW